VTERILGHEHRTQLTVRDEDAVHEHKVVQSWIWADRERERVTEKKRKRDRESVRERE
jgi:hypothetical protein